MKSWLQNNYAAGQSWVDLSTYKDKNGNKQLFTFPWKADLKSLVWYVPANFKEAGYKIPKTMEELKALTEQIVKDGGTPVVHRYRLAGRDRLAGDRLGRGLHAAPQPAGRL